ncbi:MAG: type ISP restriction/modification enzyme [Deltaproteobacteria bacterium]|nr:type ISP restriction/modification enzyme [Deltaproteobacteria bacterium]
MSFSSLQRTLGAIAQELRREPDASDRALCTTLAALTLHAHGDASSLNELQICRSIRALIASLDARSLAALSRRHGGLHPALVLPERLLTALHPRDRVRSNLYATPAPVCAWMAREAHERALARDGELSVDSLRVLDPACGTGALLDAMGVQAPAWTGALRGYEISQEILTVARLHLARQRGLCESALEHRDTLATVWEPADFSDVRSLVVLANPPFALEGPLSAAMHALKLGQDPESPSVYGSIAGEAKSRNSKWLDTGWLRFLRWIHSACDRVEHAVVVIALAHGLLENPTFATVRRALRAGFDRVDVLDLHGAARHGLHTPQGDRDESVFEIQQGVALLCLERSRERPGPARVRRSELWGTRTSKFAALSRAPEWHETVGTDARWVIDDLSANVLMNDDAWASAISLRECFVETAPAVITGRDRLAISFELGEANEKLCALSDPSVSDLELTTRWLRAGDKVDLRAMRLAARSGAVVVRSVLYRPCDTRWLLDHRAVVDRPREGVVTEALRSGKTLALVTRRQAPRERPWNYALVTDRPVCDGVLRADPHGTEWVCSRERMVNGVLVSNLSDALLSRVALILEVEPTAQLAQALFAYLVGGLRDRAWCARYGAQMAAEGPRVSAVTAASWERYVRAGREAIARDVGAIAQGAALAWAPPERGVITAVRALGPQGRVTLGQGGYVAGLTAAELVYEVGARRPALRWLEDREGQTLTEAMQRTYEGLVARVRQWIIYDKSQEISL